ncbi:MAG: cupin domain-containing protein [Alphaproteobacteria bacterium]
MAQPRRPDRIVASVGDKAAFRPFDRYGAPVPGMSWLPLSYDRERGEGTFLLRMEPGARSVPHEHSHGEQFLMLEGELVDNDGTVFRAGDFVAFAPGTRHFSMTPEGCLIAVFMRGPNRALDAAQRDALEGTAAGRADR